MSSRVTFVRSGDANAEGVFASDGFIDYRVYRVKRIIESIIARVREFDKNFQMA